jgi:hypothetical protein
MRALGLVGALPDAVGLALVGQRIQIDQFDLFEDVLELMAEQLRVFHRDPGRRDLDHRDHHARRVAADGRPRPAAGFLVFRQQADGHAHQRQVGNAFALPAERRRGRQQFVHDRRQQIIDLDGRRQLRACARGACGHGRAGQDHCGDEANTIHDH